LVLFIEYFFRLLTEPLRLLCTQKAPPLPVEFLFKHYVSLCRGNKGLFYIVESVLVLNFAAYSCVKNKAFKCATQPKPHSSNAAWLIKNYWQPLSVFDRASLFGIQLPDGRLAGTYLVRLGSYNASCTNFTSFVISSSVKYSG
jgi:hypothetical protein